MDERDSWKAAVVVAIACLAIVAAARGDLWLDEIWSIDFARAASTPLDIFAIHHDNNHVLNTLYLYVVRSQSATYAFRLFAILCGIGSVIAAGLAGESLAAMAVTGTAYPLVLYFSEARGYAAAVFFALVAFAIMRRYRDRNDLAPAIAFWIACALGMLAHLTFIAVVIAFAAGSLTWRSATRIFVWIGPPLLISIGWAAWFGHDMVYGRGPVSPWRSVIERGAALLIGLPEALGGFALVAYVAIVIAGVFMLRKRDDTWLFFAVVCLVAPALLLVVTQPRYLYFRYFVVIFPFFYLLAVRLAAAIRPRWITIVVAVLFFGSQLTRVVNLARVGRGHYRAALQRMLHDTASNRVTVGSDDDVANGTVLRFYARELPASRIIRYTPIGAWAADPPEWFIYHTQDVHAAAAPGLELRGAGAYRFVERFPFEGTSGMEWQLFRRTQR